MNTQIFNSIARILLLTSLLLLLQSPISLEAQTRIFRGTESALWDNPFNWEPFGLLPTASEDVVIDPTGPHSNVVLNTGANIKSLEIKSGTLTVQAGKTLTISNNTPGLNGIKITTSLTNAGTINVNNAGEHGVLITGTFLNIGNCSIGPNNGAIRKNGILVQGSGSQLTNDGGTIGIDNTGTAGWMTFGSGIWMNNTAMGENKNSGQILIGQNGGKIRRDGMTIENNSVFKNTNGAVKVDNTGVDSPDYGDGLYLRPGGSFLNEVAGLVQIGQEDGNIRRVGIFCNETGFFVNDGGLIRIDNTGANMDGHNAGFISLAGPGPKGRFTNKNGGQVLLGQINGNINNNRGIAAFGLFENLGCNSLVHIFSDDIIHPPGQGFTNIFRNEGLVIENSTGTSTIAINHGIVQNLNGGTVTILEGNPAITSTTEFVWQGCVSSDWNNPDNWLPAVVPGDEADVIIFNSSNDPEINTSVHLKSVHVLPDAQLTIRENGMLDIDGATANGLWNEGTILNQNFLGIGRGTPAGGIGIQNMGVFTNTVCASLYISDNLSNEGNFTNNGYADFLTNKVHTNTGTFTNNGLLSFELYNPIPSVTNNQIIVQPTTVNACQDISPAFELGSSLDFTILGIYTDFGLVASAGDFDELSNTFSPNPPLAEGTYEFYVWVEAPSGSCSHVVTWKLSTQNCCDLPEAVCQPYEAILDGNGQVSIAAADVDGGSTADCGLQSLSIDLEDFDCSHVGIPQTVELTITDVNGDSDQCFASVTIEDTTKPSLDCPANETVNTDPGSCLATFTVPMPTADDNCAVTILHYRHRPADEMGNNIPGTNWSSWTTATTANLELGHHKIQWQAKDASGNQRKCSFITEVVDNEAPDAVCLHPTVEFNGETEIFLEIAQVWDEASSSDNCGQTYFIGMSPDMVTCEQLGTIVPVTITVEDAKGNTAECTANVTVSGLPCGFDAPEDGINCTSGNQASYSPGTDTYTITSEGCYDPNYYSNSDSHGYVGTSLCGDGEIIAQVTQVDGNGWAGISMREGTGASTKMLQLLMDGVSLTRRELRQSSGGIAYIHQYPTQGKNWLRLTRSGNTFGAYHSLDGINWQAVLITNISMTNCINIGLVTRNSSSSGAVTGTFENVTIQSASSLQAPDHIGMDIAVSPSPTLEVYPNPAKGEAWVQFKQLTGHFDGLSSREVTIEVYNNIGQRIYEVPHDSLEESRIRLNVANWLPGMYLIQLKTQGQSVVSKKLIVSD